MDGDDQAPTQTQNSFAGRVLEILHSRGDDAFLRYINSELKAEALSYKECFLQALVSSSILDKFNVPRGGIVVFVLSNPKDVFLAEMGAILTGRIPIISAHPSPKLPIADFARTLLPVIRHAEPDLIVGDREYSSYLSAAIGRRVATLEDIVVPKGLPGVASRPDSPLFIQYSSGTTGIKKGVFISEAQLLSQIDTYANEIGLKDADHIVSWLPFYHDMGFITALMMPILTGTRVTLMSPFNWVRSPLSLLDVISRDKGSLCWLPNFAYNFLSQHAARHIDSDWDVSSLRAVINCSEPVSATSHDLFLQAFKPHGLADSALATSYAMAETTFAVTSGGIASPLRVDQVNRKSMARGQPVERGEDRLVSSGPVISGTSVRILGDDKMPLPDRHVGEIAVKSPSLMDGYFKNPETTAASFHDGYFLTGDLGYLDDGELFVTGRIKDLIITAGRNIYPQDIEQTVNEIEGVIPGRCVAFGIEDNTKGTENVVIVAESEIRDQRELSRLKAEISKEITAQFDIALADVAIVESRWLAKSTSGKVARSENRKRYIEGKESPADTIAEDGTTTRGQIRRIIHDITGRWLEDDAPVLTSGLIDSLALTNLVLALEEQFSKRLPDPEDPGYDKYDTVKNIEALVLSKTPAPSVPFQLIVDRETKINYLLESTRDFDSLILGSSRSFMLRTKQCAKFGLKAFQFSVAGLKAEEYYCMVKAFNDINEVPLKTLIIGTDPIQFPPHLPLDVRFSLTRQLTKYLESIDRSGDGGLAIDDEVKINEQTSNLTRLVEMRYSALDVDLIFDSGTGDTIQLFNQTAETMAPLDYKPNPKRYAQHVVTAKACHTLHPRRLHYFKKLLELVEDLGCKTIIYTNPISSDLAGLLQTETEYYDIQEKLADWIEDNSPSNVIVIRLRTPSDFGGLERDFFDGNHMGRHNSDLLLDYILSH